VKKILIVEDDQLTANIYRNKFVVEGFKAEVANDGETGFELTRSFQPDVVILDLILPKLSGVDLLKKIRAQAGFEKLPVIVLSNTYLTNLVQDAWKAGATKCLSKVNCSPKQVLETVRSALGLRTTAASPAPVADPLAKLSNPENSSAKAPESPAPSEAKKPFASTHAETIAALRNAISALSKATTSSDRLNHTQEIYRRIHGLNGAANLAGRTELAQLAEALEAFTMELHERPTAINASSLRTLASAMDVIPLLSEHPRTAAAKPAPSQILVVDDDAISRRAVTHALERAKLTAVSVEDPNVALQLLSRTSYDLVFLDVDMPGMNGHELCTKLRALPHHKKTPVVFVTRMTDFQNRANSMMSGGDDFITKPFPFLELAVKSLVYVLRGKYPAAKPS